MRRSPVDRACAIGEYDGALRDIVHALKYDGRLSLAKPLAAMMRAHAGALVDQADCAVPVPLHWRRQYRRGFNQARELARHLGVPVVDALRRRRFTRPQVELPAPQRWANVANAFARRRRLFTSPSCLAGRTIVLIDDVSTTGATLEACAAVLRAAGARAVMALTAARVVGPPNRT